jgi:hypothetical protein
MRRSERVARRRGAVVRRRAFCVSTPLRALLFDQENRADTVRTAFAVEDGGRSICRAVINEADPAWLFVSLDEPGEVGAEYIVELELEHDVTVRVGRIEVHDGHGVLAVTLDLDDVGARAVRLVGADDEVGYEVGYEATF